MAGTNNDKTVLENSPLFEKILSERFEQSLKELFKMHISGADRRVCYLLVDEIYTDWAIVAKSIHHGLTEEEKEYSSQQEARRKDVERCFWVLQAHFQIFRRDNRMWYMEQITDMTSCCVILHNLIMRLHEKGAFDDEIEEEEGLQIVTEIYDEEEAEKDVCVDEDEQELGRLGGYGRMSERDVEVFFDDMGVTESCLTSYSGHLELRADLIAKCSENR